MLPPSCRGNSTKRFIGLLHLAGFFYLAFFLFSQCKNLLHLILLDRGWEVQVEIQSLQSFSSETCRKFLFLISTFYCNDRSEQKVGTLDNSGVGVLCCTRKSLASQKGFSVMRILSYHTETW
jgi:hypothetical protein